MATHAMTGFVICLALLCCMASARQTRINRYAAVVQEDVDAPAIQAEVREIKRAPYPAAGYRPGRAFNLPNEPLDGQSQVSAEEGSGLGDSTTTTAQPLDLTTTTLAFDDLATTTTAFNLFDNLTALAEDAVRAGRKYKVVVQIGEDRPDDATNSAAAAPADAAAAKTPPARKAPYPAAGYRPSRAFLLPTEVAAQRQQEVQLEQEEPEPKPIAANANHPVCGSSTDPLAPKPPPDAKDEPDAERVAIAAPIGPALVVVRAPTAIPLVALRSQPLVVNRGRPFAYSAQLRTCCSQIKKVQPSE